MERWMKCSENNAYLSMFFLEWASFIVIFTTAWNDEISSFLSVFANFVWVGMKDGYMDIAYCIALNTDKQEKQVKSSSINLTWWDIVFLGSVCVKVMMQNFSFNLGYFEKRRVGFEAVCFVVVRWHKWQKWRFWGN